MPVQLLKHPPFRGTDTNHSDCPICGESKRFYLFVIRGLPVVRCPGCGLVSLQPSPDAAECRAFYSASSEELDPRLLWTDSATERDAVGKYLDILRERGHRRGCRLLLIAPPEHPFASEAVAKGYEIGLHLSIPQIEAGHPLGRSYDAAIVIYQLEKAASPLDLIDAIHTALNPDGILLLTVPSMDSWPARFLGFQWTEWRPENKYYFHKSTIHSLLLKCGFASVSTDREKRAYTFRHISYRSSALPRTFFTRLISCLYALTPSPLRDMSISLTTSRIIVTGTRSALRTRPLLSIVLPVYNERETFATLMDSLLDKIIEGIDREIIIVESNSSDGTRELAQSYEHHKDVRLFLQDRARGKGNAVRLGLQHATGDIILIQDADLEYDLNDYEALLEHVIAHRALFVLGARHGGNWKMRRFATQWSLATLLNLGHVFFTKLINFLYRQKMSDPFTMYKVFHRDCLHGMRLNCNRFDFDHELVIKLILKGYVPLEIPVNYWSRSFKEGKKVSLVRDPLSWLWVDLKFRFLPISCWLRK